MFNDEEIELTDVERAMFAALPKERPVNDLLEARVVNALKSRGVLSQPRRGNRFTTIALRTAAAVFIFAAGALTERIVFGRHETERVVTPSQVSNESAKTAQVELWI
ncbi:MAG: hypothetical protein ABR582_06690 [Gemmatimonadaceae bacterium]